MTSQILSIYAALALKQVSVGGVAPDVFSLAQLPNTADTAATPCRLLLPVGDNAGEGREVQHIAIGNTITVNWQIKDLMLWKPVAQGIGLREYAPVLVEYAGAYAEMLREFRAPTATDTVLEGANIQTGIFEYPSGSGKSFYGALCTLDVKEVIHV